MKKTFLLLTVALVGIIAHAQVLEVVSMQQIAPQGEKTGKIVGISPKGDYLLLTSMDELGLKRYDLNTKALTTICKAEGAGWDAKISPNGNIITYRQRNYEGDSRIVKFDIMTYNAVAGKTALQAKAQTGNEKLVDVTANVTVSISEDLELVLTRNGKRIVLNPNGGEARYNWPGLSPDGSKIVYYVSGEGCYVCDLMGQNVQFVARHCRAAQWYDNQTIIGMADEDDGHDFTASALVAYTLDGKSQTLVTKDKFAMYPYTAEGKVAFSTPKGEMYLLKVK